MESRRTEDEASRAAADEQAIEDVPGAPTWPIRDPETPYGFPAAPVGLNWESVADALRVDRAVLEHDGILLLPGEYFPESGYFLDPVTFRAVHVDVGDMAVRPGYFLSNLVVSEQNLRLPTADSVVLLQNPIVAPLTGPVTALFIDPINAERARRLALRSSLASGARIVPSGDAVELRIETPELPGRVATLLASLGGSVITVGQRPVVLREETGPMATRSTITSYTGDARRGGTGVTSGSPGPEYSNRQTEAGQGREFKTL